MRSPRERLDRWREQEQRRQERRRRGGDSDHDEAEGEDAEQEGQDGATPLPEGVVDLFRLPGVEEHEQHMWWKLITDQSQGGDAVASPSSPNPQGALLHRHVEHSHNKFLLAVYFDKPGPTHRGFEVRHGRTRKRVVHRQEAMIDEYSAEPEL